MARGDKLPREPGLPRDPGRAEEWVRALVARLTALLAKIADSVNLLIDGYVLHVGALPSASEEHRGRMVILRGASGTADRLFWCKKNADDTYTWQEVV